ncbi:complement C4 [Tachysurus ichikawai]
MELKVGAEYLIMGQDDTLFVGNPETRYILDNKMWIEEIPPAKKCKATKSKRACQLLESFIESHAQKKCAI